MEPGIQLHHIVQGSSHKAIYGSMMLPVNFTCQPPEKTHRLLSHSMYARFVTLL